MKKALLGTVVLICAVVLGCPGIYDPYPPTTTTTTDPTKGLICQDYYDNGPCGDGDYMQMCLNPSLTVCGYVVKGRMYYCANCDPIDCESAAYSAVRACWGSLASEALQTYSLEEVSELEESLVEDLINQMELLH